MCFEHVMVPPTSTVAVRQSAPPQEIAEISRCARAIQGKLPQANSTAREPAMRIWSTGIHHLDGEGDEGPRVCPARSDPNKTG